VVISSALVYPKKKNPALPVRDCFFNVSLFNIVRLKQESVLSFPETTLYYRDTKVGMYANYRKTPYLQ
jgi:hypothetical protein